MATAPQATVTPRPHPPHEYSTSDAVSAALVSSSMLSIVGLSFVIFSFVRWRRLRRHPASIVIFRSVMDLLFCVEIVTSHLYHRANAQVTDDDCQGFTFATQFLAIGAEAYGALLSFDLLLGLSNPFTSYKRNMRVFHCIAVGVALVASLPLDFVRDNGRPVYGRDNYLAICWLRTHADDGNAIDVEFWLFWVMPLASMYVFALATLAIAQRRLQQGLPETFEARLAIFRSSVRFVISYSLYWIFAVVVYWTIDLLDDAKPPDSLDVVLAFFLGSRGIVTCTVWLLTYGRDLRLTWSGAAMPPKDGTGAEDGDMQPIISNALRKEILYYTSLGIARGALRAKRDTTTDGVVQGRIAVNRFQLTRQFEESGLFDLARAKHRASSVSSGLSNLASATAAGVRSASSDELREALLQPGEGVRGGSTPGTPRSRTESMHVLQRAASAEGVGILPFSAGEGFRDALGGPNSSRSLGGGGGLSGSGMPSSPYGSMNSLQDAAKNDNRGATRHIAGLLRSFKSSSERLSSLDGRPARAESPTPPPPPTGTPPAGPPGSKPFEFVDFEPHVFARLRELAGIPTLDYVRSLSRTARERFSEGASGAFLYFSSCERFIVKTLSHRECFTLLGMLHDYAVYMERHPHSLIARFYGLHSITMYGATEYFAVMQNVLQSYGATIHERYDLKGSWVNRHRVPLEHGEKSECRYCGQTFRVGTRQSLRAQCPARPNHPHEANTVLRDADWSYRLCLAQETAQALGDMIVRDSEFLRRHGIMDYSLLLGIHRNKYKLMDTAAAAAAPPHAGETGRLESAPDSPDARKAGGGDEAAVGGVRTLPPLVPLRAANPADDRARARLQLQQCYSPSLSPGGGLAEDGGEAALNAVRMPSPLVRSATGVLPTTPFVSGSAVLLQTPAMGSQRGPPPLSLSPLVRPAAAETGTATSGGIVLRLDLEGGHLRGPITPFFAEHKGGLRALVVEGPGTYYMGIIDCLQTYTWSKWLERQFKTLVLLQSPAGVSVTEPTTYARRFRARVIAQLMEGYEWKGEGAGEAVYWDEALDFGDEERGF